MIMVSGAASAGGAQESAARESKDLDYAQVVFVKARQDPGGAWRFDVTVRHRDQGWDHYCDLWQVVDPDTDHVIGERVLLHPHDTEQPFTRSQSGIETELLAVRVRASCNVHGFGGHEVLVDLSGATESDEFAVLRR